MAYNPDTNTITVDGTSESFLRGTAGHILHTFPELAALPDASASIVNDWRIIKAWIGATSDTFTDSQREIWELTYISYLAEGRAPSLELDESFRSFAKSAEKDGWDTIAISEEIRGVCDRLLATDEQIERKRKTRLKTDAVKAAPPGETQGARPRQSNSVFRGVVAVLARLRHSPEVNVALSALEQVRPLFRPRNPFQSNAVDLAFQTAAEIIKRDKDATVHSISVDQVKPRDLALLILSNVTSRALSSGQHHVYRGVLNGLGEGYFYVFECAVTQLSRSGFMTAADAQNDIKSVREDIRQCG